jgi:hypothetical protein
LDRKATEYCHSLETSIFRNRQNLVQELARTKNMWLNCEELYLAPICREGVLRRITYG